MSPDTNLNVQRKTMGVLGAILLMSAPAVGFPSDPGPDVSVHASRFEILVEFQGDAVLDTQTQLIWERTPSSAVTGWATASLRCALKSTGGRLGWRLPSFFELMTLVEPSSLATTSQPTLPASHPFRGVRGGLYWTTNVHATEPTSAYAIDFLRGDLKLQHKHQAHAMWCVQGGTPDAPTPSPGSQAQTSI
jgi:hypothetical protein